MTMLLLPAAILTPLAGSLVIAMLDQRPNIRDSTIVLVASLTFALNLAVLHATITGTELAFSLIQPIPGVALGFAVERLGIVFALVASGLWIVTSLFAFGYMRGHHEPNQTRFYICFAVAIFAALGIAYSQNLFTLFVFYEILTLSTYPLVTHKGDVAARNAGRLYLGILLSTSIGFFLFGLIWVWQITGTTEFTPGGVLQNQVDTALVPVLLALFIFGTGKAAVMPVHRWLPAAMVAPTPVSALLHAVAVVKAGVFTILKICVYIFGIDFLAETSASTWLAIVASFTIVVASTIAINKDNLKARLAYSTVSQLSYIVLGAAFATTAGALGAAMHIVMHAFGKITLFFCAGAIYVAAHKTEVSTMNGIGRQMPLTMLAFAVGSASIIGLPLTGGMWSKWFLSVGAADAEMTIYIGVLAVSSLLSIAYLAPVIARAFFRPLPDGAPADNLEKRYPLLWLPPVLTALGCIVLFFTADHICHFLMPMVDTLKTTK